MTYEAVYQELTELVVSCVWLW